MIHTQLTIQRTLILPGLDVLGTIAWSLANTYIACFLVGCRVWTVGVGGVEARLLHVGGGDASSLHVSLHCAERELKPQLPYFF